MIFIPLILIIALIFLGCYAIYISETLEKENFSEE